MRLRKPFIAPAETAHTLRAAICFQLWLWGVDMRMSLYKLVSIVAPTWSVKRLRALEAITEAKGKLYARERQRVRWWLTMHGEEAADE